MGKRTSRVHAAGQGSSASPSDAKGKSAQSVGPRIAMSSLSPAEGQRRRTGEEINALMKKSFAQVRSANKATAAFHSTSSKQDAADKVEPVGQAERKAPPPIRTTRRPLRRRTEPEWACVDVLSENDERGPFESTVRCRFCHVHFMANTQRIRAHIVRECNMDDGVIPENLQATMSFDMNAFQQELLANDSTRNAASFLQATQFTEKVKTVEVVEDLLAPIDVPLLSLPVDGEAQGSPVPPCLADLTNASKAEHKLAIQWLREYDRLHFFRKSGIAITAPVARVLRDAESATKRAVLYPSKENFKAAAEACAQATNISKQEIIEQWQTTTHLRLNGCGLTDFDCFHMINLISETGVMAELRAFDIGQNTISDASFVGLCRRVIGCPDDSAREALRRSAAAGLHGASSVDDLLDPDVSDPGMEYYQSVEASSPNTPFNGASKGGLQKLGNKGFFLGNRLTKFSLCTNPIGDAGMIALAHALHEGGLPGLLVLDISGTATTMPDGSPRCITAMTREAVRQQLLSVRIDLKGSIDDSEEHERHGGKVKGFEEVLGIGDKGLIEFSYLLQRSKSTPSNPGMLTGLKDLRLFGNSITDSGVIALSTALAQRAKVCRNLESMWLQDNYIGDKGMCFMVETLFNGGMVSLRRILMADNCIAQAGVESIAVALARGALSNLVKVSLSGNPIPHDSVLRLTSSLGERMFAIAGNASVEIDIIPHTDVIDFAEDLRLGNQTSLEQLDLEHHSDV